MSGGDRRISEPYQQRKIAKKLGNAAFNKKRPDAVRGEVLQQVLISCLHGKGIQDWATWEQIGCGFWEGELGIPIP